MKCPCPSNPGVGLLVLRLLMGTGIAYHGYQKIFGGMMPKFTAGVASMGFPMPEAFAWAAALSEFLGGILIALGLFTQPAALFVLITMCVAAFKAHAADPFNVKELALAYASMSLAVLFAGAGPYSIDGWCGQRCGKGKG